MYAAEVEHLTHVLAGGDPAQPQRGDGAHNRREKYEYAQVVASESKCHLFGPSGRGDDEIRPAGPIDRPEAEEHRRGADGQRPTDRLFVANHEESLDVLSQESAHRRE